jgi:GT2 family glycosyltransferase
MDLSVIIVALNGRDMTLECLGTIHEAAGWLKHEIVVVDNGSSDDTADAIKARFPSIRVIRNKNNRGYGPAANQGMRIAKGRVLAFVNNDTRLPAGSLAELFAYLESEPKCSIVGPRLQHEDGRPQHSFDVEPSLVTELFNKSLLRRLLPRAFPSRLQEHAEPFAVDNLVGACFVVRRALLKEIGLFDEAFFYLYEETDLCRRARQRGRRVMVHPGISIVHLQGRTRRSVRVRAKIEQARSRFTYFRKHHPRSSVALRFLFPIKALVESVAWGGAAALTLGLWGKARGRLAESAAVLGWQLAGCPRGMGLDRRKPARAAEKKHA